MKTDVIKRAVAATVLVVVTAAGSPGLAQAQTVRAKGDCNVTGEKTAINKDLAAINVEEQKVAMFRTEMKEAKRERNGTQACAAKASLAKANADLNRSKGYLKVDKTVLLDKHMAVINARQKAVWEDFTALNSAKLRLLHYRISKKPEVEKQKQIVMNDKRALKNANASLKQAVVERNNDLLAINKQIKDDNAEPQVRLAFENAMAKGQDIAVK